MRFLGGYNPHKGEAFMQSISRLWQVNNTPIEESRLDWQTILLLFGVFAMFFGARDIFTDVTPLGFEMSTWQNFMLLLCAIPYALKYGFRQVFTPILAFLAVMLVMSFTVSLRQEGLSVLQTFKSLFSLALAPTLFQLRQHRGASLLWLRGFAFYPVISIIGGLILAILLNYSFYDIEYTGAFRWYGTSIPPHTGTVATIAMIPAFWLARKDPRYYVLAILSFGIAVFTGTRTALICMPFVILPELWTQYQLFLADKSRRRLVNIGIFGAILGVIFIAYFPFLNARNTFNSCESQDCTQASIEITEETLASEEAVSEARYLSESGQLGINTAGRTWAWTYYWNVAMVNPLFGRGLGAGTLGIPNDNVFRTPHNEYLRLLVEGGIVGAILGVIAYGATFFMAYRGSHAQMKIIMMGMIVIFAINAFFLNPLSVQELSVPFWFLLGSASMSILPNWLGWDGA
jgi:O-antigen ligase